MTLQRSKKLRTGECPLKGVVAFVEISTVDGGDASSGYTCNLKSLGAEISSTFGQSTTHLIWSYGSRSRLAAAVILGITAVHPAWVEKCLQCNRKVDEEEFSVVGGIIPREAAEVVLSLSSSSGLFLECSRASATGRTSSSSSSSSNTHFTHSSFTETKSGYETVNIRGRASPSSSSFTAKEVDPITDVTQASSNSARNNPYLGEREISHSFIPLPSYREHNTGVLPVELKVHRRSERICDLEEESNLTLEEPETLEEVMGIDPSTPLTILRDNEWPPGGGKGSEIRTERKVPKRKSPCKQNIDSDMNANENDVRINVAVNDVKIAVADWTNDGDTEECLARRNSSTVHRITRLVRIICERKDTDSISRRNSLGRRLSDKSIKSKDGDIPRLDDQELVLLKKEERLTEKCTYVVCPVPFPDTPVDSDKLSLRVLFALARGTPLLTSGWVDACLAGQHWKKYTPYICTSFKKRKTRFERIRMFKGYVFFIALSTGTSPQVISSLIEILGGHVTDSLECAHIMILGNISDAEKWRNLQSRIHTNGTNIDTDVCVGSDDSAEGTLDLAFQMSAGGRNAVRTWKYICDCVVKDQMLKPSSSTQSGHLITFNRSQDLLPVPDPLSVPLPVPPSIPVNLSPPVPVPDAMSAVKSKIKEPLSSPLLTHTPNSTPTPSRPHTLSSSSELGTPEGRGHWSRIRNDPSQSPVTSFETIEEKSVGDTGNGCALEKNVIVEGISNNTTSASSASHSKSNGNVSSSSSGVVGIISAVVVARARGRPPKQSTQSAGIRSSHGNTPNGVNSTGSGGVRGASRSPDGSSASAPPSRSVPSLSCPQAAHASPTSSVSDSVKVTGADASVSVSPRKREREEVEEEDLEVPESRMNRKWGSPKTPS